MHLGGKQFKDQINADLKLNPWCLQKGTAGGATADPSGMRCAGADGEGALQSLCLVTKGPKPTCNEDLLSGGRALRASY